MSLPRSCVRCLTLLPEPPGAVCPACGSQLVVPDAPITSLVPDTPIPDTHVSLRDRSAHSAVLTSSVVIDAPPATAPVGPVRRAGPLPILEGYEVRRILGMGGMGLVYEAVQTRAGRVVALKVVQKLGLLDAQQRVRFDAEARALGQLAHPNIVTMYEVGEEDGTPFFSMEYVDGGTLADLVRDGKQVPPPDAARIIAAAAAAVAAAHDKGILHRDLKPGNILLAADGTPKVADFGLAKWLDQDDGPTHTGVAVGTPNYMAPEQVDRRFGAVGPATDVYGLGATLYHLLTGRPPFQDENPVGTAVRVTTEEPAGVRTLCPAVSPVLEAIVRKAMAKAPGDRYPSAAALAADLTAWGRGEPTVARPPTRGQRLRRRVRRHRLKLAAAILVPLVAMAAAIARREAEPLRQLERELDRGKPVTLIGETGPPRWLKWELGPVPPDPTLTGDGAFAFQTRTRTMIELCPDARHDRYRLSVELRHVNAAWDGGYVGAYVACPGAVVDGDLVLRRLYVARFHDFVRALDKKLPQAAKLHGVEVCDYGYYRTEKDDTFPMNKGAQYPDRRLGTWAGQTAYSPWRRLVFDATPDELSVYWEVEPTPGGPKKLARVAAFSGKDFEWDPGKVFSLSHVKEYGRPLPNPPSWGPRGSMGLIAQDSSVAYRNVLLTPNPEPFLE